MFEAARLGGGGALGKGGQGWRLEVMGKRLRTRDELCMKETFFLL